MPRGVEWVWLSGIAATGLVLFNVALVAGSRHRAGRPRRGGGLRSLDAGRDRAAGRGIRPRAAGVGAALVVTCGAGLVQGLGRADGLGVAWAAVVFGCESAFTLLAIPVLGRHGPWGVSVHTTWIAAAIFAVMGLGHQGPAAAVRLGTRDWLAVVYLAVAVTAAAFVMWYSSAGRLGVSRAGLLTGVAPVAAAAAGVLLGGPAPRPLVWAGIAVVAAGLVPGLSLGLRAKTGDPSAGQATSGPATSSLTQAVAAMPRSVPLVGQRPKARRIRLSRRIRAAIVTKILRISHIFRINCAGMVFVCEKRGWCGEIGHRARKLGGVAWRVRCGWGVTPLGQPASAN